MRWAFLCIMNLQERVRAGTGMVHSQEAEGRSRAEGLTALQQQCNTRWVILVEAGCDVDCVRDQVARIKCSNIESQCRSAVVESRVRQL